MKHTKENTPGLAWKAIDKQPVSSDEAFGLFTELPLAVQSEIMSAPSYLRRVQIARRYFPTLAEAVGIAKICTPQTEAR